MTFTGFATALCAKRLLVLSANVACASINFSVPIFARSPLMAVKGANTVRVSFMAIIFRTLPSSPKRVSANCLVGTSIYVCTSRVPIGAVTRPVTMFQLRYRRLRRFIIAIFPKIMINVRIRDEFFARTSFDSRVSNFNGIRWRVYFCARCLPVWWNKDRRAGRWGRFSFVFRCT